MVQDRAGHLADFQRDRLNTRTVRDVPCSYGSGVYASFNKSQGVTHQVVRNRQDDRVTGAFHIQHVNGYHRRLKEWMEQLHGVATYYLRNYLDWCRMLERYGKGVDIRDCLHEALERPMQGEG